jgi:hydroxyacylglutathione hydrolase
MNLIALPAFADNDIWMVDDDARAIATDPGDRAPVTSALASMQPTLAGILVTPPHDDHAGGLAGLRSFLNGLHAGPACDNIPSPSAPLCEQSATFRHWNHDIR